MFTNRSLNLLTVIALLVITACGPQTAPTPISSTDAFTPTMKAALVTAPTLTPVASPIVEASPL